ncbi:MAG: DUF4112 domain-containing protein [Cyanobacteria bacterium P01_A01_bin.135]
MSRPPNLSTTTTRPALERLRSLSDLLDNAIKIPGTDYRVGLDPILGLLPAGGDVLGTVLSAYLVVEAVRLRMPTAVVTRMAFNIVLEMVVGAVPVLGDLFDFAWKANARNLRLLESKLDPDRPSSRSTRQSRWLVFGVLVVLGLVLGLVIVAYAALLRWLVGVFGG